VYGNNGCLLQELQGTYKCTVYSTAIRKEQLNPKNDTATCEVVKERVKEIEQQRSTGDFAQRSGWLHRFEQHYGLSQHTKQE
jgi:hypothetical protein